MSIGMFGAILAALTLVLFLLWAQDDPGGALIFAFVASVIATPILLLVLVLRKRD